jgi:tRNA (cytidine/uridine-2'-O-)-methyltransferase
MHIVLVEPEIPGNTGNIARLCAATGCELHLVKPLGFSIEDRYLKRAGLDYWHLVKVHIHENFYEVQQLYQGHNFYFNTTKASKRHSDITYRADDLLVFGKETAGLPMELLNAFPDNCVRVPMLEDARSLNLSNTVAIAVYEALRQQGFPGLR